MNMIDIAEAAPLQTARRPVSRGARVHRAMALTLACSIALAGCATNQDTGTAVGALGGAAVGAALAGGGSSDRRLVGALIGAVAGGYAGSLIGKRLDDADRARAEAAAQKAIAEREATVAREQQARNAQIEAQLRAEQAKAKSEPERVAAQQRALEARQRVARSATTAEAAPVPWTGGNARGSAQAVGPTQVAGREGCEQVREIAIIKGEEVRQNATFCRDPSTGARVRV